MTLDDALKGDDVERANLDVGEAVGEGSPQLLEQRTVERCAVRYERTDPFRSQPSRGVHERARRRRIEPLHVVDRDHDGSYLGERPQHVQEGDADGVRVGRRALVVVVEYERATERTLLGLGQRSERVLECGVEHVAQTGERERGLAFGGSRSQHAETLRLRFGGARLPERRLPDPRLAFEHQCRGSAGDARNEVAENTELGIPANDSCHLSTDRTPAHKERTRGLRTKPRGPRGAGYDAGVRPWRRITSAIAARSGGP